jgi:nicotinate-nucleotide adenylyltransferase
MLYPHPALTFMRIALFGGTFDPIHRGHLAIATAAADAFALDQVLFAPTGHQPLKDDLPTAPFADRLAMVALACDLDPRFTASSIDQPHSNGQPNFTVDTLTALRALHPEDALFNLVGADSFLTLPHWRSPARLLDLAEWIVVSRPNAPLDDSQLASLTLTTAQRARVHLLTTVHEDVSATELRQRLESGDPCPGLLPSPVTTYIQSHRLYR